MDRHTIIKPKYVKSRKRIGRGVTRGVKSGRGNKGQRSRSGANIRPAFRDEIKKIPKLRGHSRNRSRTIRIRQVGKASVNLSQIEGTDLKMITPKALINIGIVKKQRGKIPVVKILGMGNISRKIEVASCDVSQSAKDKIIKSGGNLI